MSSHDAADRLINPLTARGYTMPTEPTQSAPEAIETPDLITLAVETAGDRAHDAGECGGYPSCDLCYHIQCEEDAAEVAAEWAEENRHRASFDCCGGMVCRCPDDGPDQDGGAR